MAKRTKKRAKAKRRGGASTTPNRLTCLDDSVRALAKRILRIEEFLGTDLKVFHDKQFQAAAATSDG
jgi:hypothetical protein